MVQIKELESFVKVCSFHEACIIIIIHVLMSKLSNCMPDQLPLPHTT